MHGSGPGEGKPGGVDSGGAKRPVVLKKRKKKKLGMNCDKNCPACRATCETPFFPTLKKHR